MRVLHVFILFQKILIEIRFVVLQHTLFHIPVIMKPRRANLFAIWFYMERKIVRITRCSASSASNLAFVNVHAPALLAFAYKSLTSHFCSDELTGALVVLFPHRACRRAKRLFKSADQRLLDGLLTITNVNFRQGRCWRNYCSGSWREEPSRCRLAEPAEIFPLGGVSPNCTLGLASFSLVFVAAAAYAITHVFLARLMIAKRRFLCKGTSRPPSPLFCYLLTLEVGEVNLKCISSTVQIPALMATSSNLRFLLDYWARSLHCCFRHDLLTSQMIPEQTEGTGVNRLHFMQQRCSSSRRWSAAQEASTAQGQLWVHRTSRRKPKTFQLRRSTHIGPMPPRPSYMTASTLPSLLLPRACSILTRMQTARRDFSAVITGSGAYGYAEVLSHQ